MQKCFSDRGIGIPSAITYLDYIVLETILVKVEQGHDVGLEDVEGCLGVGVLAGEVPATSRLVGCCKITISCGSHE